MGKHRAPLHERHNYSFKLDRHTLRKDLLATLAEGMGTLMFLTLAFGATQSSITSNQAQGSANSLDAIKSNEQIMYIATSFGLALLVSCWSFYRVSGSVFNPAVSLSLGIVGVLSPVRMILYIIVEIIAAIAAAAIIEGAVPGSIAISNGLSAGTTQAQGVIIELLCTFSLCFVVLMLAVEKSRATPLAPIAIGLTLFVDHLFALTYTGAGINPARSFGPEVVSGFKSTQWIFWVGPIAGGILASIVYAFLKYIKYWELNEGQDATEAEASPAGPLEVLKDVVKNDEPKPASGHPTRNGSNDTMV